VSESRALAPAIDARRPVLWERATTPATDIFSRHAGNVSTLIA
jgi:hypothetical protein